MEQEHAVLTEEMLEDVRRRIGVDWQPREPYFNVQATRDTIRHFAHGIGDGNPLWCDPDYASTTPFEVILAPPSFLYSVYWCSGRIGLPGIHAWHSGNDWTFFRRIKEGEIIQYRVQVKDLVEKKSQMAGRTFIEYCECVYETVTGEPIARCLGWSVRAERRASGDRGKYRDIEPARYTSEELRQIYNDYAQEENRGATPRYWEDVEVGDELTPVVKGPLSMRDMFAWLIGAGSPFMKAHGIALDYQQRHPGAVMVDNTTGQVDVPELVHMEPSRAREIGIPDRYDYGAQRMSWLFHVVTNWMGDAGFLTSLYGELRRFNVVGDTTWIKGKVTRTYIEDERHLVDIDIWGENQRGEITVPGRATVQLPSRSQPGVLP
jgi:acyl dehydratase